MSDHTPFYPERAPIEAYGGGGFRFADARHEGGLLILPSGMYAWRAETMDDVAPEAFARVFDEAEAIDFLLFGTGVTRLVPSAGVTRCFADAGIGLEIMDTGAACRTYNILLGEARAVAAALLPVD